MKTTNSFFRYAILIVASFGLIAGMNVWQPWLRKLV